MQPAKKTRRRCPAVATSDDATGEYSSLWTTSLPGDLLLLVAWHVLAGDFLDYIRFRAVCRQWRDGTMCPRGRGVADPRFHPRRWLMFPEGHGLHPGHNKLRGHLRFLNLDTGIFVRLKLPHFRDHCILDSVDGLLLLQRDHDAAVFLLHPFTGDLAELPPLSTLLPQLQSYRSSFCVDNWFFISLGMLATVSCDADAGTITVMILFYRVKVLAFATTKDKQWTLPSWDVPPYAAPLAFHGKIYMVQYPTYDGSLVFQIDPPPQAGLPPPPPKLVATCPVEELYDGYHLVECDSKILLAGYTDSSRSAVVIYKLEDIMLERFVPVTSIGDHALFLLNTSLSVSTKATPTVMAETVVFEGPSTEPMYMQYHLGTGTWCPAVDESGARGYDPGPRSLIQHIITCCIRSAWNKGLICSVKEEDKDGWLIWKVKRKFRHWS
uniref:Uncharacterized protein n=1 Tax=Avena sativa TaxID=4498 RepID=A0ACD5WA40_AVESA